MTQETKVEIGLRNRSLMFDSASVQSLRERKVFYVNFIVQTFTKSTPRFRWSL